MSSCICTKTSYEQRGIDNQDPWILLTFEYLSKVENQYSFYVLLLSAYGLEVWGKKWIYK